MQPIMKYEPPADKSEPYWRWKDGTRINLYDGDGQFTLANLPETTRVRFLMDISQDRRGGGFRGTLPFTVRIMTGNYPNRVVHSEQTFTTTAQLVDNRYAYYNIPEDITENYVIVELLVNSSANTSLVGICGEMNRRVDTRPNVGWLVACRINSLFYKSNSPDASNYSYMLFSELEFCEIYYMGGSLNLNVFYETKIHKFDYSNIQFLVTIPIDAFGYTPIKEFEIPENVTSISGGAFRYSKLEKITFAPRTSSLRIDSSAFWDTYIKEITIPETVTGTANSFMSFSGCNMLEKVTIPALSLQAFVSNMFINCYSLKEFKFYGTCSNVMNGISFFQNCDALEFVDMPNCKFSNLIISSTAGLALPSYVQSERGQFGLSGNLEDYDCPVRINWAESVWSNTSGGAVKFQNLSLSAEQINAIFRHIIEADFTGCTINITNCLGAADCDRTIITNAGGIVVG
jgi:hypothetical protein